MGVGVGIPVGYGTVGVGRSRSGESKSIKIGTLVIEIRDGVSGELLWQAVASDTIKGDPKKIEAKVVHYMGKAFEDYPPRQDQRSLCRGNRLWQSKSPRSSWDLTSATC